MRPKKTMPQKVSREEFEKVHVDVNYLVLFHVNHLAHTIKRSSSNAHERVEPKGNHKRL